VEAFTDAMGGFHRKAAELEARLTEDHKAADAACKELRTWFGEDAKTAPEQLFSTVHDFVLVLEKAHKYNVECDEKEKKKAQMAEAAKQRAADGKGKPEGGESGRSSLETRPARPGMPALPGLGGGQFGANDELASKLAKRAQRANLVDNVEKEMATGRLLKQRRQESFERRGRKPTEQTGQRTERL